MALNRLGRFKPSSRISGTRSKLIRGVILVQQRVGWERLDLAHGLGSARAY